jgi:hypothetical protein
VCKFPKIYTPFFFRISKKNSTFVRVLEKKGKKIHFFNGEHAIYSHSAYVIADDETAVAARKGGN